MFKDKVIERFREEFGEPFRKVKKVVAWNINPDFGAVVQIDQPNAQDYAYVWLPYPPDKECIPGFAIEYAAESGRHSNAYSSPGLEKGKPTLKLIVTDQVELDELVLYIHDFKKLYRHVNVDSSTKALREVDTKEESPHSINVQKMPKAEPVKPRREAIPRVVQREVWQRDGGKCVECNSKAKLCFDHIIPFSKGGSNTVRNIQILCERCNLAKGNRIWDTSDLMSVHDLTILPRYRQSATGGLK